MHNNNTTVLPHNNFTEFYSNSNTVPTTVSLGELIRYVNQKPVYMKINRKLYDIGYIIDVNPNSKLFTVRIKQDLSQEAAHARNCLYKAVNYDINTITLTCDGVSRIRYIMIKTEDWY